MYIFSFWWVCKDLCISDIVYHDILLFSCITIVRFTIWYFFFCYIFLLFLLPNLPVSFYRYTADIRHIHHIFCETVSWITVKRLFHFSEKIHYLNQPHIHLSNFYYKNLNILKFFVLICLIFSLIKKI